MRPSLAQRGLLPLVQIAGLLVLVAVGLGAEAAVAQPAQSDSLLFEGQEMPLAEALGHAADVMQLDLAFAPKRVEGKVSNCHAPLPSAGRETGKEAEAVLRCVLRGTELEARRLGDRAFVVAPPAPPSSRGARSVVRGSVRDRSTHTMLTNVNVTLVGTPQGDATNSQGAYHIDRVPPGRYLLQVTRVGFSPATVGPVHLTPTDTLDLDVALTRTTIPMAGPVVTPRFTSEAIVQEVAQTIPGAGYQSIGLSGVSVGLLVSIDAATRRVQFSPLGNLASTDLHGVQLSGGVNAAGGAVRGIQVGGMGNLAAVSLRGVQLGGTANAVEGTLRGVQASGSINLAYGAAIGTQLGGAVNVAGRLNGGQFGGVVNVATETVHGVQLTGSVNVGRGIVHGAQLAGGVNLARRRLRGLQVAPLNVAGAVRGVQLGIVNVARQYRGAPIGFVSYVQEVGLRYDAWIDASGMTTVALRSGTHRVSNFLGIGVRPQRDLHHLAAVLGLGLVATPTRRIDAGLDLLSYNLFRLDERKTAHLLKLRLTAAHALIGGFAVSAGPTLNAFFGAHDGRTFASSRTWASGRIGATHYRVWPGFVLGLQFAR